MLDSSGNNVKRQYMNYKPDITLGNILAIIPLLVSMGIAYGIYTRDQEKQDGRLTSLERNQEIDKKEVKDSLTEVKGTLIEVQKSLTALDKSVAVSNAKGSK